MEDHQRSQLYGGTFAEPQENFYAVRLLQQCHTNYSFRQNTRRTRAFGIVLLCSGKVTFQNNIQIGMVIQTGKFLGPWTGAAPFIQTREKTLRLYRILSALPDADMEVEVRGLLRKAGSVCCQRYGTY